MLTFWWVSGRNFIKSLSSHAQTYPKIAQDEYQRCSYCSLSEQGEQVECSVCSGRQHGEQGSSSRRSLSEHDEHSTKIPIYMS